MLTNKKLAASARVPGLVMLGIVLLAGCTPPGPRAVREGLRLIRENRPAEAVQRLEEAVRMLPGNPRAWNYLGLAYHHAGRPSEAAKAYQQALTMDRNLAAARYNLGCLYLEQGNLAAAATELQSYTAFEPGSSAGWTKLGSAQFRARQFDAAERSYTQALKLDSHSAEALNGLGMVLVQKRRPADAWAQFNNSLKNQSNYPAALLNLAIMSQQSGTNRDGAIEKYRSYLALKPTPAHEARVREIVERLERELNPATPPNVVTATLPPVVITQPTERIPPALTLNTQRMESTASLARTASPTGSVTKAPAPRPETVASVPAATSAPPGRVASNLEKSEATNAIFTSPGSSNRPPAASTNPPPTRNVEVVQIPADEPLRMARDSQALPSPTERHSAPATNTTAPAGSISREKTPPAQAPAPTPTAKPRNRLVRNLNPANWFRSSDSDETGASSETVVSSRTPESTGSIDQPVPGAKPAQPTYRDYRYLSPANPAAGNRPEAEQWMARGARAQERNRLSEAIDCYRKAGESDPSLFEAHYNLGVAAFEAGNLSQALSAYEQALAIQPGSMKARFNFAAALDKSDFPKDAAKELERVVTENPSEARAQLALASLYVKRFSDNERARVHYLRFLELDPGHPDATSVRYWLESHP